MSQSKPLIVFVMSLRDWLLAAWIYEELFDDDLVTTSHNNTHDYDSSDDRDNRDDYDDYDVFKDLF